MIHDLAYDLVRLKAESCNWTQKETQSEWEEWAKRLKGFAKSLEKGSRKTG